jgi:O-antigen/teichoic acid export membrane protein
VIPEARGTVRNAGWILVQRGLHAGSGFVFAILVPRLMGPDIYGRYSLLESLSIWFLLLSSLSLTSVIGRYVPELILRQDNRGLGDLWSDLFTVRFASGVLAALLYLGVTVLWLRDLTAMVLAIMAAMVSVRAIAELVFAAFVGFGRAARWQVGETIRQWLSLGLVVPGFYLGGLQGAVLSLFVTELVVLALGIYWLRPYMTWPGLHLDVRRSLPYLQFGLVFFASDVLRTAMGASGQTLVRAVSGEYVQSGYFGLASRVLVTMSLAMPQIAMAFTPLLTTLHAQGQIEVLSRWLERLLKYLVLGGMVASFGVLLLADDLVPVVLGAEYGPVAANLKWLAMALPSMAVGQVARMVATVYVRPRTVLVASAMQLLAFWLLGIPLVAWLGSLGSAITTVATWTFYSVYLTWRMQDVLRYSLRECAVVIGLGMLFVPLAWLRSSWMTDMFIYLAFAVAYLGLLWLLRVVTRDEAAEVWKAIVPKIRGARLQS